MNVNVKEAERDIGTINDALATIEKATDHLRLNAEKCAEWFGFDLKEFRRERRAKERNRAVRIWMSWQHDDPEASLTRRLFKQAHIALVHRYRRRKLRGLRLLALGQGGAG